MSAAWATASPRAKREASESFILLIFWLFFASDEKKVVLGFIQLPKLVFTGLAVI